MKFKYKILLDEKEKKRREGWDAKGTGKVADMPAAPAGRSSVTFSQLNMVGWFELINFKVGSVKVFNDVY
jgi:hypothetical protein